MNDIKLNDNIPTLTQIIQSGDESMRNHFDASYFDNENELNTDSTQTYELGEKSNEKQEPFISDSIEQHEAIENLTVDSEQSIDTLQSNPLAELEQTIDLIQTELQGAELEKAIDLIIYEAVQKVMPEIEQKLTQQISQQIQQKFFNKNADK